MALKTSRFKWNEEMLALLNSLNNFHHKYPAAINGEYSDFLPFIVGGERVGIVHQVFACVLKRFPDVFHVESHNQMVSVNPNFATPQERTEHVDLVLRRLREEGVPGLECLHGWRDEHYVVSTSYQAPALMSIERAAHSLFGFKSYGVHINGYVQSPTPPPAASKVSDAGLYMWIGRRSKTKPTYPGRLDNVAAGGLTAEVPIQEVLVRECMEEASIPEEWSSKHAVPTGCISYCFMTKTGGEQPGVKPERQFCFDLPLPIDFVPKNTDGETEEFYLWPIEKVRDELISPEFKPNVSVVILDFLARHGFLHPDTDHLFCELVDAMHKSI